MQTAEEIKKSVKEKYGEIAVTASRKCCCGSSENKIVGYTIMKDDYTNLEGYVAEADLGLSSTRAISPKISPFPQFLRTISRPSFFVYIRIFPVRIINISFPKLPSLKMMSDFL